MLWLNSTLGLLILLGHREETRGGWVDFKKPTLATLPVIDVQGIGAKKRRELAHAFDEMARWELKPLPHMASDTIRAALDDAVARILGLPNIAPLRELLAREPVICLTMDRLIPCGVPGTHNLSLFPTLPGA